MGSAPSSPVLSRNPSPSGRTRNHSPTPNHDTLMRDSSFDGAARVESSMRIANAISISSESRSPSPREITSSSRSPRVENSRRIEGAISILSRSPSPSPRDTTSLNRPPRPEDAISISSGSPSPSPQNTTSPSPKTSLVAIRLSRTRHSPPSPPLRPLSPLTHMRLAIATDNEDRRNNSSRVQRRPQIIESTEAQGCHCRFAHKNFTDCSSDPRSPFYKRSPGELETTMEKKQKLTAKTSKKRKAQPVVEDVKYKCECGGGHDNEMECEYAVTLKKHIQITTSIVIGSQEMVTIVAGTEPKQTFLVYKELLALYSGYFEDVFAVRPVKNNIPDDNEAERETPIKQEVMQAIRESVSPTRENSASGARRPYKGRSESSAPSSPRSLSSPANTSTNTSFTIPDPAASYAYREDTVSTSQTIRQSIPRPHRPTQAEKPNSYTLPHISPSQFAQFVSFLHAGLIIDAFDSLIMTVEHNSVEALWYVGQWLRSPYFQNYILENLRISEPVKSGNWPSPEDIEMLYDLHKKHDLQNEDDSETENERRGYSVPEYQLKKFAVHCLSANNTSGRYQNQSREGRAWQKLFDKRSDIVKDAFVVSGGTNWALVKPWDDKLRGEYMVAVEEEIEERWERMILAKRGTEGLKLAAKAGDIGAKLEQVHLAAERQRLGYDRWGSEDGD